MRYYLGNLYSGILGISIVLAASSCNRRGSESTIAQETVRTEFCNFSKPDSAVAITTDTLNVKLVDTKGMVLFYDGKIRFGSYLGKEIEKPIFEKALSSFLLDKNPVSVRDFRLFVQATGYKTEADIAGQSLVYLPYLGDWSLVKGANWEYPLGHQGNRAEENHPVTHISYNDAVKYSLWLGKRLPTEFEYEYALKVGKNLATRFPWGDEPSVLGRYKANFSQAESATDSVSRDSYFYTSPIGSFGSSVAGMNDLIGNVWEWTSSSLNPYPGSKSETRAGPNSYVIRGGSFMINPKIVTEFALWSREELNATTSRFDVGFRCASSVKK